MVELGMRKYEGEPKTTTTAVTTKTRNDDSHRPQPWTSIHTHPSPLQRDVGEFLHNRRRAMKRRTPGGTQKLGGPVSASGK
jgi:hypothetical protein